MEKKYEVALKELFKENGHDISFERASVPIANGTCEMLYVIGEGNGYPAFRVEQLEELERKYAYGGVKLRLEECVKECVGQIFIKESLCTRENVLDNVYIVAMNKQLNEAYLADKLTRDFCDVELACRVFVKKDGDKVMSFMLPKNACEIIGVTEEELWDSAVKNSLSKVKVLSYAEVLGETLGVPVPSEVTMGFPNFTILMYEEKLFGAGIIALTDVFKELSDKKGDDLMIFPSSIHELIVMPAKGMDVDYARQMVSCVNETEVSLEEFLSNSVYIFQRENGEVSVA